MQQHINDSNIVTWNAPNLILAGAVPQTSLGELTALPRLLGGFKGSASKRAKGREVKGKGMKGGDGEKRGRKRMGEGRGNGK